MGLTTSCIKVAGNPVSTGWSQVHDFEPTEPEKLKLRGRFFAVISASASEENIDYVAFGREILTRLHEEYFGNLEKEAFEALKGAVEAVFGEFIGKFTELEIGASSFLEGTVYTAASGGAEAAIFRNNMLAKILVSKRNETISASGFPQKGDILLLGTANFFSTFADGVIRAKLGEGDIASAAESFTLSIYAKENSSKVAVALIRFTEGGEESKVFQEPQTQPVKEKSSVSVRYIAQVKKAVGNFIGRFTRRLPEKEIYVKQGLDDITVKGNKQTTLTAGIILIAVLFISIFFGVRQKIAKDKRAAYEGNLQQASHLLSEAKNLITLDPARSRELLLESKGIMDELSAKGVKDKELTGLLTEMDKIKEDVLAEYEVTPELFIDLALLSSGFKADTLSASEEYFVALDKSGKRIAQVNITTKKAEIVAGPSDIDQEPKDVAVYVDKVYLLTDSAIFAVSNGLEKLAEIEGKNLLLYAYTGNLYLLDKDASSILRYQGLTSGLKEGVSWLGAGQTFNFSGVSSWTIDGSVWLGYSNGRILRLTQGVDNGISISGVVPQIASVNSIYSNADLKGVYVLDTQNKRVVVFDKEGKFIASYSDDSLADAKGMVASEKNKKILFSKDKGRIYSIETKHLK